MPENNHDSEPTGGRLQVSCDAQLGCPLCQSPVRLLIVIILAVILFILLQSRAESEELRFEEAIEKALANSPTTAIAAERTRAAAAGLRQAEAAFWPQLQLSSTYARTNNPPQAFFSILSQRAFSPQLDFNDPQEIDNLNTRAQLEVVLYNGGSDTALRKRAAQTVAAAESSYEAAKIALAYQTAQAYFTLIKTGHFIAATHAEVNALESNYAVAERRFREGMALKTDLLDVSVRLVTAREDKLRAENAAKLAERALINLLGGSPSSVTASSAVPLLDPPSNFELGRHPQIQAAEAAVGAAEAAVRAAEGGFLPRLSAFGEYDYDKGWETDGDGDSWIGGVAVQLNAWDGMLTAGRVEQARAELSAAQESLRQTRLVLELGLEQARLNLDDARERLRATASVIEQAQESAELNRARFAEGLATVSEILDAETALTSARVRRAEAETDERIAIAALRAAVGMGQL